MEENNEDGIETYRLVLTKKTIVPKCCICGSPGSMFSFTSKTKANVYCDAMCEQEHARRDPSIPTLESELIIKDKYLWARLFGFIALSVFLLGVVVFCL